MAGGGGAAAAAAITSAGRTLQETPTWALATVCFIFISVSLCMEHLIHLLSHWLKKRRKNALYEAVEKLKSGLMVLGFMSLILTVTQRYIIKICIPNNLALKMLPCHVTMTITTKTLQERILAAEATTADYCSSKGMTSLISQDGLNQLSYFIFGLAIMQIVYSLLTMALGRAKMKRWRTWENETQTTEYQVATDPNRFRFTRQTTFGRRHMNSCTTTSGQLWIKCFFRQFFSSVAKVDYLTLRHGFISAHLSNNNNSFNFQKYIQRSLEDDFKVVVGISPLMWFLVVVFMLVDVHGWHMYLWVSFLPLIVVLVLGTKLEVVVAKMALQLKDQNNVIKGAILVQPNDNLFWFHHPRYVLTLLHYTLFVNAFEVTFFVWVTFQYGISSCYHEHVEIVVVRVVLAVTVQILCSYITLPLYALVTQMGSQYKRAILEDETANVIKQWHAQVKQKRKNKESVASPKSITSRTMESPDPCTSDQTNSPKLSSYIRSPTFSDSSYPTQFEIVEHRQQIDQHIVRNDVVENS